MGRGPDVTGTSLLRPVWHPGPQTPGVIPLLQAAPVSGGTEPPSTCRPVALVPGGNTEPAKCMYTSLQR